MSDKTTYEGWVSAFETSTDFEADLVRDRLDDADVPAVVLTQRDHAFNLNMGDLSPVHVMVPPQHYEAARAVVESVAFTDAELEAAALAADPNAEDAHTPEDEAALDSGNESIRLSPPDADDDA